MKRIIKGTTGRSTEKAYIKSQLFDYLADQEYMEIDNVPAERVVDSIYSLAPVFDVDDVIQKTWDEGISIVEAIDILRNELDNM